MVSTIFLCALLFGTTVECLQTIRHSDHLDVMHEPGYICILAGIDLFIWCIAFRCIGGYTYHQRTSVDVGRLRKQSKFGYSICNGAKPEQENGQICDEPDDFGMHESNIIPTPPRKLSKISRNQDIKKISPRSVSNTKRFFFGDPRLEISYLARDITPCFILIVTCSMIYLIDQKDYPNAPKYVDPLMALTTIAFLVASSIPLMKKTGLILLQSLPEEMQNVEGLKKDLMKTFSPHIITLHEVHVWCLVPSKIFATLHVVFKDEDSYMLCQSSISAFLLKYGINNPTIQPEFLSEIEKRSSETEINPINRQKCANENEELQILNTESLMKDTSSDIICCFPCPFENCLKKRCCPSKEDIQTDL